MWLYCEFDELDKIEWLFVKKLCYKCKESWFRSVMMEMEKYNVCNMYVCICIYYVLIDMKVNIYS